MTSSASSGVHPDGLGEPFELTRTLFIGNIEPLSTHLETAIRVFEALNGNTRNFRRLLFPPFPEVWDADGQRLTQTSQGKAVNDSDAAGEGASFDKVFCYGEWADKSSASIAVTAMRAAAAPKASSSSSSAASALGRALRCDNVANKQAIGLLRGTTPMVTPSFPLRPLLLCLTREGGPAPARPLSSPSSSSSALEAALATDPHITISEARTQREVSSPSSSSSSSASSSLSPAVAMIRQAVMEMSHSDLLQIVGEVRAMATASVTTTATAGGVAVEEDHSGAGVASLRDLLASYPSLTFALLFAEERLGMLHSLPSTLAQLPMGGSSSAHAGASVAMGTSSGSASGSAMAVDGAEMSSSSGSDGGTGDAPAYNYSYEY